MTLRSSFATVEAGGGFDPRGMLDFLSLDRLREIPLRSREGVDLAHSISSVGGGRSSSRLGVKEGAHDIGRVFLRNIMV